MTVTLEPCPGCTARLPPIDGPTHRYIGASPACWAIYSALLNAGEPPLAPGPYNALLVDAYAAQHPGTPSDQAIQSVAVHLLTLYGVLVHGAAPADALWIRQRAVRGQGQTRRGRYQWLAPPSFAGSISVADIVAAPSDTARTDLVKDYVHGVWSIWSQVHLETIQRWYTQFIVADRL
jgi:hypothetical protein